MTFLGSSLKWDSKCWYLGVYFISGRHLGAPTIVQNPASLEPSILSIIESDVLHLKIQFCLYFVPNVC